jgi:hypothetical protein
MCFYDQIQFKCGDRKWATFRHQCPKEYRAGETCGMRLVNQVYNDFSQNCRLCEKIHTKVRSLKKEEEKINRWKNEKANRKASIEKSEDAIDQLNREIYALEVELNAKRSHIGRRITVQFEGMC